MNPFEESKKYFKTPLQEFVFYDKYSRYNYDLGRRETWVETVDRAVDFLRELSDNKLDADDYDRIRDGILTMKVMPSMRLLAMAGEAARRDNLSIFNCSFVNLDCIDAIVEIMILSMAGVGVGYSVERKCVDKLPPLPNELIVTDEFYVIQDNTEGWGDALRHHLTNLYNGKIINFDYSKIRPSGTPLRIKGGRASGPEVLQECLDFITVIFKNAVGRKLKPIELHDIACCIGYCSISGGVRRTALISLFDIDDDEMRNCKSTGDINYRWFANNSAVWDDEPTKDQFDRQMSDLFDGMRGEPGIFNRVAIRNTSPKRRNAELIDGMNPCGEVYLRDQELCNLSSAICREEDTIELLAYKVKVATIIGTIQSKADKFVGVRSRWYKNQDDERLLGVDLNGQMDCPMLREDEYGHTHEFLREVALLTNKIYSEKLGINQAAAVTVVKPNGNSSQLVDASSGIHPRYSKYYIRNVRVSVYSPLYKVLFKHGVPMSPENGQDWSNITTAVIHFPVKSPEHSKVRDDFSAIDMCNFWKLNKINYTEMNPSCTINYKPEEENDLKEWIWHNRAIIGGMAFLPYSNAKYDLMPYVEITEEEYNELLKGFPIIDWSIIEYYEKEDMTESAQTLACMSGTCDLK